MFAIGVDENGLGPRLGPLVVTSIAAEVDEKGALALEKKLRGKLAGRLGDSKDLVAFGRIALGEAWARAIPTSLGRRCRNPAELLDTLALDDDVTLRALCPDRTHIAQCWTQAPNFEADESLVNLLTKDLARLKKRGVRIASVKSVIVCNSALNREAKRGISRFRMDLSAMERLLLSLRAEFGEEIDATCGKVGGFDRYPAQFSHLSGYAYTTLEEGRAASRYRIAGLGRVSWVRDADASNLLVSMASLVGKWVREALMGNIVRFYQSHVDELAPASGYHDPVTTRFVNDTASVRKRLAIVPSCFERDKATS